MRSVNAMRRHRALPRDPAPSKWGYRYQRLMLTPGVRGAVRTGVPLILIGVIAATWFSNDTRRAAFMDKVAEVKASVQQRPEFMVTGIAVNGADTQLTADVMTVLPVAFPQSSFDLDLEEMRGLVEALNAVESARLKVGSGGVLQVDVVERVPVAVWRDGPTLRLIDRDGVFAGTIVARADRLDLPLIAGDGAQENIAEALRLFAGSGPIAPRVRGLVRMGERRWDIVLDRDQRILLPETNAEQALDRVIVLNQAQDMLERDVSVVDMRKPDRPTVRMQQEAAAAMRRVSETGN